MITLLTNLSSVVNKYLSKLQDIKPGGKSYDTALHKGADEALTSSRERIHTRGLAGDDSDIGQYSTTPMYVSTKNTPSPGSTAGKGGKEVFNKGGAHRSHYFAGGYKEYKSATGGADKVNLTLTGEMRDRYEMIKTSEGYGLGWADEQISKRAEALEEKYGKKIWTLTAEERKALIDTVKENIDTGYY